MNTIDSGASPYQTPQKELLSDNNTVGEIRFFSPSCRIGRLRYLAHSTLLCVVSFIVVFVFAIFFGVLAAADASFVSALILGVISIAGYVFLIVISAILSIQRLHDQDLSGWLWLLMLVPIANLVLWVMLIFVPGTQGVNQFGPRPPPNQAWHWVLGLVLPVIMSIFMVVGLIFSIAYYDGYMGY